MKNYPIAIDEKIREAVAIINDGDVWTTYRVERFQQTFPTLSMFCLHQVAYLPELPICRVGTINGQSLVVCQTRDYETAKAQYERDAILHQQETEQKIETLNRFFGS